MRLIRFYDPGDGGGSDGKGSAKEDPKPDPAAERLKALETELASLRAAESKRKADEAAAAKATEEAEAKRKGEYEKLLADRDTKLGETEKQLGELTAREKARLDRLTATADKELATLPEHLQDVAKAIPDPEARLDAIRKLSGVAKQAEERPAGAGERGQKPPKVVIPAEVEAEAKRYGVEPSAYYALQIKRGKIKLQAAEG